MHFLGRICSVCGGHQARGPIATLLTRPPEGRSQAVVQPPQRLVEGQQHRHGLGPTPAEQRPIQVGERAPRDRKVERRTCCSRGGWTASSARSISMSLSRAAISSGLVPLDPRVPSAPRASSSAAAPACLTCWACIKGVQPWRLSRRFGSAPASSSSVMTSTRPARAAQMSGVQLSAAVSADSVSSSALTAATSPLKAADASGVEGVARHAVNNKTMAIDAGRSKCLCCMVRDNAATRPRRNERDVSGASDDAEDRDQPSTSMTNPPGAVK